MGLYNNLAGIENYIRLIRLEKKQEIWRINTLLLLWLVPADYLKVFQAFQQADKQGMGVTKKLSFASFSVKEGQSNNLSIIHLLTTALYN